MEVVEKLEWAGDGLQFDEGKVREWCVSGRNAERQTCDEFRCV
jgi:hypothetical protein